MFAMLVPGILLFSVFFGLVGLFIGMAPFVILGLVGLVTGLVGLVQAQLRLRSARRLEAEGIAVWARCERRERASVQIWNVTPMRIVCVGETPERFQDKLFHSDWFVDARGGFEELPQWVTVMVAPENLDHYHVDLRPFRSPPTRLGWRWLILPAGIMVLALPVMVIGTLMVGEGPRALRPPQAQGMVMANGHAVGKWSFQASGCNSGAPQGFFGVSVFDAHDPNQQLTLIHDKLRGEVLDADIPGQNKSFRFFPRDCSVLKAELHPMNSVVNRITNLEGRLDAECQAFGDRLSAHVTFQLCH